MGAVVGRELVSVDAVVGRELVSVDAVVCGNWSAWMQWWVETGQCGCSGGQGAGQCGCSGRKVLISTDAVVGGSWSEWRQWQRREMWRIPKKNWKELEGGPSRLD